MHTYRTQRKPPALDPDPCTMPARASARDPYAACFGQPSRPQLRRASRRHATARRPHPDLMMWDRLSFGIDMRALYTQGGFYDHA